MLKFFGALLVALVVFISAENTFDSFKSCVSKTASKQSAESTKNESYIVVGLDFIDQQSLCSIRIIDAHNGFFAATAAFIIAGFTYTLWRATTEQARLTGDAIRLGNKEYTSTHRPKLRLQRILSEPLKIGSQVAAKLEVINIGDTDAKISAIGISIFRRQKGIPRSGKYNAVPLPVDPKVIQPGQQADIQIQSGDALTPEHIDEIRGWQIELCLLGMIHYLDENKTLRPTSFFRIYDPERKRFMRCPQDDENADCEYEG